MKTSEECFLEICNKIKNDIENNKNLKIDKGETLMTSIINYSKNHNYEGYYVYDGYIILSDENFIKMKYYFSNKRSYISIDDPSLDENNITKYEYILLKYIDTLFFKHKIDIFINSLYNNKKQTIVS